MNFAFIRGRVDLPDHFEDHVRHRMGFALDRFAARLHSVTVRLDDVNGPRGGADKLCRVLVQVRGLPEIFVEDRGTDAHACVDSAAHRTRAAVARAIQRQRSQHGRATFHEMQSSSER